jgi:hypothetical protein
LPTCRRCWSGGSFSTLLLRGCTYATTAATFKHLIVGHLHTRREEEAANSEQSRKKIFNRRASTGEHARFVIHECVFVCLLVRARSTDAQAGQRLIVRQHALLVQQHQRTSGQIGLERGGGGEEGRKGTGKAETNKPDEMMKGVRACQRRRAEPGTINGLEQNEKRFFDWLVLRFQQAVRQRWLFLRALPDLRCKDDFDCCDIYVLCHRR